MAEKNNCPCPHDPYEMCPCDAAGYNLQPVNSYKITAWEKMNDLIIVSRNNAESIKILPNLEYPDPIPQIPKKGYNTALKLETTSSKQQTLYVGFAVKRVKGHILIQAVVPK